MIRKRLSTDGDKMIVAFEIPGSVWADQIHLVGDFNDWDRKSLPFRYNRRGDWQVELELDRGREYRFRYLFDGEHWRSEWRADRHAAAEDGIFDSIVVTEKTAVLGAPLPRAA